MIHTQKCDINVVLFLLKLIQNDDIKIKVIEHKFLISNHSFLLNDSNFGYVEFIIHRSTIHILKISCLEIVLNIPTSIIYERIFFN